MNVRRAASAATALAMVLAIVPAAAFARGPVAGKHEPAGLAHKTAAHGSGATTAHKPKSASSHAMRAQGGAGKAALAKSKPAKQHGAVRMAPTAPSADASGSVESSGSTETTVAPRLHGIANALSHLQANLARMQARLDAGDRTALPGGLVSAIAKFMSWLGLTPPSVEPTPTPSPTPTSTPVPSPVPTSTPEPTSTPVPTETPVPVL